MDRAESQGPAAWAVLLFLGLASLTWRTHVDLGDAQLYQVVARHMAEDGRWLALRYLPDVHPRFYEHLPFGLWPFALAIRLFGEGALRPLCAAFSVGTLLLTGAVARRAAGRWAGVAAMLLLALPDSFFVRASNPFLEPLLLLLATGAAVPLLLGPPRPRDWAVAGLLAAAACAVKGPFGLLPFAGAAVARAAVDRSAGTLLAGMGIGLAAVVPTALFLVLHPDWWEGYGRHQLLASAAGARTDGEPGWNVPWLTVLGRFWPGLPLAVAGGAMALGRPGRALSALLPVSPDARARRTAQLLLVASLFVLAALCLPQRKVWNHALVVFPLLAMLGGVGVGPWLESRLAVPGRARRVQLGLALVALAVLGLSLTGVGGRWFPPPCVAAGPFAPALTDVPPGANVLVVSLRDEWGTVSALALERRWLPWRLTELGPTPAPGVPADAPVAFVADGAPVEVKGWQELGRHGRWRLFRRSPLH